MHERVTFRGLVLPGAAARPAAPDHLRLLNLASLQALWQSLLKEDPFGLQDELRGLGQFRAAC